MEIKKIMSVFVKAFSKTSIGSICSVVFGAISVKIIAIVTGPQGVGIFSILKDLSQTLVLAFSLSGNQAIVRNLSTKDDSNKELFIQNIVKIILFNTFFMSLMYFLFIEFIFNHIFNELEGTTLATLLILLLSAIAGSINVICNSILNAKRKLGWMAISQTTATLVGALATYPLVSILSMAFSFPLILVVINFLWLLINLAILQIQKINFNLTKSLKNKVRRESINHFASISGATFFTGIAGMLTILLTRFFIEYKLGVEVLGIFDAAWTLGSVYILFLLRSFGTYVLPVMSSLSDKHIRDDFIGNIIIVTSSIFTILVITMIAFNKELIFIFYSSEFYQSSEILQYLLLADFFKVISFTFGIFLLSQNRAWVFLFSSLSFNVIFLIILFLGIDKFGLYIIAYSSIITQIIYLIILLIITKTHSLIDLSYKVFLWLIPMFIIIFFTWYFSGTHIVYVYPIAMLVSLLMAYYLLFKKKLFLG